MNRPIVPIVASGTWGLALPFGLVGALFSVMFFDAPGSMSNPAAWINALVVVSFPCLCAVAIPGAWMAWRLAKDRPSRASMTAQIAIACLPVLPIAYVIVAAFIAPIVLALLSGQPPGLQVKTFPQ